MSVRAFFVSCVLAYCLVVSVDSCRCGWTHVSERFNRTKYVFVGKAINSTVDVLTGNPKILFQVEEVFKGLLLAGQQITVNTDLASKVCGKPMLTRQRWQIWAHDIEDELTTSTACRWSTRDIDRDIDFLRRMSSVSRNQQSHMKIILMFFFSVVFFLYNI
jgi:hypothetical protein